MSIVLWLYIIVSVGRIPSELWNLIYSYEKARMMQLLDGEIPSTICLAVLTQYRSVTDWQAATQTYILRQYRPRYTVHLVGKHLKVRK